MDRVNERHKGRTYFDAYHILMLSTILSSNVAQVVTYIRTHKINPSFDAAVWILFGSAVVALVLVGLLIIVNIVIQVWPKRANRRTGPFTFALLNALHRVNASFAIHLALFSINLVLQIFGEISLFCDIPT
uniref:Uncharacterized protein n=1 Tax=Anopheles minimus TaxID=112268 RepID=A0A182VQ26_9DIPT